MTQPRTLWLSIFSLFTAHAADRIDFTKQIQPILETSCHACHGPKLQMGGLRLDSKKLAFAGGQTGKAIQPGKAAVSLLYQRVAGASDQARMPMGAKPLDPVQIALLRDWIEQGAEWPDEASVASAEVRKHWAYIAPQRPALPPVRTLKWPANPIDRFVLARLEKEGLAPSLEAGRVTLLRRLSLDLIGLPPS